MLTVSEQHQMKNSRNIALNCQDIEGEIKCKVLSPLLIYTLRSYAWRNVVSYTALICCQIIN